MLNIYNKSFGLTELGKKYLDMSYVFLGDDAGDYFVQPHWYSGGLNRRYFHSAFGYIKDKRIRICIAQKEMNRLIYNGIHKMQPIPKDNIIENISERYDLTIDEVFELHTNTLKEYIKC